MTIRIPAATSILLLLFSLSLPAQAQDKKGFGISAGIGGSLIRDKDGSETFEGNAFGYSLAVEYRFSPNVALGAGWFALGTANDTVNAVDAEIEVYGSGIFGRLIYPMSDKVDLYGRLGGVTYHADIEPGGLSNLDGLLFGDDAVELGLGVDISGSEKLDIRIEGRYFNGSSDETGALLTVGFNFRF